MVQNKAIVFKAVPNGFPKPGQDLVVESTEFDLEQAPPAGGATAKIDFVSFDPYQRGRMRPAEIKSYAPAFDLGKPITNRAIATILKSDNPKFKEGDLVWAEGLPNQEYTVLSKERIESINPVNNPHKLDTKIFLGALGMPGLTAYSSLYEIGKPKKGETIFVSAASGAVGQLVGAIAKHEGLTVIGSVGDDEKLAFIEQELGFAGFNYKKEKAADALARLAPGGIDIYYENVGGETLEAAIDALNPFGRIVACGMISEYNSAPEQRFGVKNLINVVGKRLTMRGFIVGDAEFGPKYYKEHNEVVSKWIADGTLKPKMSVSKGIDNGIDGLLGLFSGKNFGKAILEL